MLRFLGRRIVGAVVALLVASILIFTGEQVLPGNAASVILGRNASPAAVSVLSRQMGLDRPLYERYGNWLGGFVQGNLGNSSVAIAQGAKSAPIWNLISSPLKNSAILAAITALLMIPLSLGLGVLAAVRVRKPTDHVISLGALASISLPEFVTGSLLIAIFFVGLHLLPPVALVRARGQIR